MSVADAPDDSRRFFFASNLQPLTCDPDHRETLMREGWLLSQHYQTPTNEALAAVARDRGLLMSDNGNWSRAGTSVTLARALHGDEPSLEQVLAAAQTVQDGMDQAGILAEQLRIRPHFLIGPEDLRLVALLRGDLLPHDQGIAPDRFLDCQRATFERFVAMDRSMLRGALPLMVLHAWDGSSARFVGEQARAFAPEGIAVSVGVSMRSRTWMNTAQFITPDPSLPERIPDKYPRSVELVANAILGLGARRHVHVLGAASPILMALVAGVAPLTAGMSVDSAAPVLDARDNWIYGDRQALLKMRVERLLAWHLTSDTPLVIDDPFFRKFAAKYPHDHRALRDALGVTSTSDPREVEDRVRNERELVRRYMPYLVRMGSVRDPFYVELMRARTGTNVWVLQRICRAVRRRLGEPRALDRWIAGQVARYVEVAHPSWAAATRVTLLMLREMLGMIDERNVNKRLTKVRMLRDRALADARRAADELRQEPDDPRAFAHAIDRVATGTLAWARTSNTLGPSGVLSLLPSLPTAFARLELAELPRGAVGATARGLATAVLVSATEGWNAGRVLRDRASVSPTLARRLAVHERRGRAALRGTWNAARAGDLAALRPVLAELVELIAELPGLCADVAAAPLAAQLSEDVPGLRVSRLVRELGLGLAAIPLLGVRLSDDRLQTTTRKLAERRARLLRPDGPPGRSLLRVPPLANRRSAAVRGVVVETGWIERPDSPYAWARLDNGETLVLPHKRFRTRGVVPGSVVWARGYVKREFAELGRVLEVEPEGPGTHEGEFWVDWLSVELRGAIDLAPGSMRIWWEMPDPRSPWSHRDLTAHLPQREVEL